jgi:hypothetical protein
MEVAGCWKRRKQQRMRDKSERMQDDGSNDNDKEKNAGGILKQEVYANTI